MTRAQAEIQIAAVEGAALQFADAVNQETSLEDARTQVKIDAIHRLMASGVATSVTASEKVVELDPDYMRHRERQRGAVAQRILLSAKLKAAELRARLAVELAAADPVFEEDEDPPAQQELDKIYVLLSQAGIIEKGDDGLFLSCLERVELLISSVLDRETA